MILQNTACSIVIAIVYAGEPSRVKVDRIIICYTNSQGMGFSTTLFGDFLFMT